MIKRNKVNKKRVKNLDITFYKVNVRVKLKKDLRQSEYGQSIGQLINVIFSDHGKWTRFHKSRERKGYTFSSLVSEEKGMVVNYMSLGEYASFYISTNNVELANRVESNLFGNTVFEVLDVGVNHYQFKGNIKSIQIKNPILFSDDREGNRRVLFLRDSSNDKEKIEYIKKLNEFIKDDFEYITKEELPLDYKYIQRIEHPKTAHYDVDNRKLLGTKGVLYVDQSILGKIVTQHLATYGIGMKSSYLGAGSIILRG